MINKWLNSDALGKVTLLNGFLNCTDISLFYTLTNTILSYNELNVVKYGVNRPRFIHCDKNSILWEIKLNTFLNMKKVKSKNTEYSQKFLFQWKILVSELTCHSQTSRPSEPASALCSCHLKNSSKNSSPSAPHCSFWKCFCKCNWGD